MTARPQGRWPYKVHTAFAASTADGRHALVMVQKDAIIFADPEFAAGYMVDFLLGQERLCVKRVTFLDSTDRQPGAA